MPLKNCFSDFIVALRYISIFAGNNDLRWPGILNEESGNRAQFCSGLYPDFEYNYRIFALNTDPDVVKNTLPAFPRMVMEVSHVKSLGGPKSYASKNPAITTYARCICKDWSTHGVEFLPTVYLWGMEGKRW